MRRPSASMGPVYRKETCYLFLSNSGTSFESNLNTSDFLAVAEIDLQFD